jgi:glycosyltransferase involved in cell wall biosynthesis
MDMIQTSAPNNSPSEWRIHPSQNAPIEYPLISIGIPTFNRGSKLEKTLLSIWQQEYPTIEVIISDNCSSDITEELCKGITKDHISVKYFRQAKNIGMVANFEFVLRQAAGDFFMWISDDDTLEPGILKKYSEFLMSNPDYSLVSGQILYWFNGKSLFREMNFSMEQNSKCNRVIRYYFKVVHGALYYGLMRRKFAKSIPQRNRIGDDWHFVATMAYLGKIKNLDCIGYHKMLGGISKDFKEYAEAVEDSWFSADFPRIKIAFDAFYDIQFLSPIYSRMPIYLRFPLAVISCVSILIKYFFKEFPFIVGGKIKRLFWKVYHLPELQ